MTTHLLHNRLTAFLMGLECLDRHGRRDAMMNEVIENGGAYVVPNDDDLCGTHLVKITLHGVTASAANEDEAIRYWAKIARSYMPDFDDDSADGGFVPPRNHAEEIANARRDCAKGPLR